MNTSTLIQKVWNFCDTLRAAFAGQQLPQDLNVESASVLLARLRAERAVVKEGTAPSGRKAGEPA